MEAMAQTQPPAESAASGTGSSNTQCHRCGVSLSRPLRCSQCLGVHYCSQQCQKDDWPTHKQKCPQLMASTFRAARTAISEGVERVENLLCAAHLAWTHRVKDGGAMCFDLMGQVYRIASTELKSSIPSVLDLLCERTPSNSSNEKRHLKEVARGLLAKALQELPWDSADVVQKEPNRVLLCLECLDSLAERLGAPEEALSIAERHLPHIVDQRKVTDLSATVLSYWLQLRIYACPAIGSGLALAEDEELKRVEQMAERALQAVKRVPRASNTRQHLWLRLALSAYQYLGEATLLRIQAEILTHAIPWVPRKCSPLLAASLPILLADALIWEGRLSEAETVICRYETKEANYRALADLRLAFIAFERGDDRRTAEVARRVYAVLCKDVSCDEQGYDIALLLMNWCTKSAKKLHGLAASLSAKRIENFGAEEVSGPDEYGIGCSQMTFNLEDDESGASSNLCLETRYTHYRTGAFHLQLYNSIKLAYAEWELELHRIVEARGQRGEAVIAIPLPVSKILLLLREASSSYPDHPQEYCDRKSWSRRLGLVRARALLVLVDYLGKLGKPEEVEKLRGDLEMPSNQDIFRRAREEMRTAPKPDVKGYLQRRARKRTKKLRRKQRQAAGGSSGEESGAEASGAQEEVGRGGDKSGEEAERQESEGEGWAAEQAETEAQAEEEEKEEEEEECAICFFDLSAEAEANVTLSCRHVLHRTCLDGWVDMCKLRKRAPTCPMCRQDVVESN